MDARRPADSPEGWLESGVMAPIAARRQSEKTLLLRRQYLPRSGASRRRCVREPRYVCCSWRRRQSAMGATAGAAPLGRGYLSD